MLAADHDVLRDVLQTDMKAQDLGLASKIKQVESEPKPKEKLDQIIQRARGDRSRRQAGHRMPRLRARGESPGPSAVSRAPAPRSGNDCLQSSRSADAARGRAPAMTGRAEWC